MELLNSTSTRYKNMSWKPFGKRLWSTVINARFVEVKEDVMLVKIERLMKENEKGHAEVCVLRGAFECILVTEIVPTPLQATLVWRTGLKCNRVGLCIIVSSLR